MRNGLLHVDIATGYHNQIKSVFETETGDIFYIAYELACRVKQLN